MSSLFPAQSRIPSIARKHLIDALRRDTQAKVVDLDGWMALPAFVPPNERRGLVLIQAFCDEVRYNEQGNELTLIKRRETADKPAMAG